MEREIKKFFDYISLLDDAYHETKIGYRQYKQQNRFHVAQDKEGNFKAIQQEKKKVWRKKKDNEYLFGKPGWRKIE